MFVHKEVSWWAILEMGCQEYNLQVAYSCLEVITVKEIGVIQLGWITMHMSPSFEDPAPPGGGRGWEFRARHLPLDPRAPGRLAPSG